jgi:nucleotide-binding universal stress UspA family protein
MRLLVGVAEQGGAELVSELDRLIPLRDHEVLLAHVIDTGVRGEIGLERARFMAGPLPRRRARQVGEAEQEAASAALAEARAPLRELGVRVSTEIGEGEPGRVLSALAAERGCALVVVASRPHRGAERPGPHSVGRTARFVLDHSPRPVLLIRGAVAATA